MTEEKINLKELTNYIYQYMQEHNDKPTYKNISDYFDLPYITIYHMIKSNNIKGLIKPAYNLTSQKSIDEYYNKPQRKTYCITKEMVLLEMAKIKQEIEYEKRKIK